MSEFNKKIIHAWHGLDEQVRMDYAFSKLWFDFFLQDSEEADPLLPTKKRKSIKISLEEMDSHDEESESGQSLKLPNWKQELDNQGSILLKTSVVE